MATIDNLNDTAHDVVNNAELTESEIPGVQQGTIPGSTEQFFTSSTNDIDLTNQNVNNAVVRGTSNLDITGNENDNILVGNHADNTLVAGAGNDYISTGFGNDTVDLSGGGDNIVEIDGAGTKTIIGGAGNDLFIIKGGAAGEETNVTFSNLTRGDKLRVYADKDGDGAIDANDVESIDEVDGNTVFTLIDGTVITLEGVTSDTPITYTVGIDENGEIFIELS